jgi:hypothetical protein
MHDFGGFYKDGRGYSDEGRVTAARLGCLEIAFAPAAAGIGAGKLKETGN